MRPITVTQTGSGSTSPIPMDHYRNPFNVGIGLKASGTVNYTVQHTFDDVFSSSYNPATGTWFNHPVLASLTTNADGNYAFPCTAIRITVNSGSGSVNMTLVQAGMPGE
jgi:archaellum component FlaF (FlaF/FlaG flagellin family)